ncbi:MAG: MBOAT family protein [Acidobacteria bacterium]|nr:MBOAT family protein [Acidobacteriota bacterium]
MLFNSFEFLVFLPFVLLVYHNLNHGWQNRFLVAASCFFYGSWDWRFLFPLLTSTTIDYWCAKKMEAQLAAGAPQAERKRYVVLSVVTNLGLLGFFKYFNFFSENLYELLASLGVHVNAWTLDVILPVGISFYTFQALSYTIDVYRGEAHATNSFWDFFLAVLYFPHLVAGPIQRAQNLLAQVTSPRHTTRQQVFDGLHLIFWGYFKKVFIADNLGPLVDQVFQSPSPDGFQTAMAVYGFCFQIYCDFSGYTDIARGVAKLMGFEFMLNFNLPYFATNAQEFWTRWHISLSTWLRDYLYIPLGGNRNGVGQTYRNLMLTMVIGGLWHGAAWNFILWGFYHGTLLVTHRYFRAPLDRIFSASTPWGRAVSFSIRLFVFFHLTCYGWLLFRATSLEQVLGMTASLFRPWQGYDENLLLPVLFFGGLLMAIETVLYATDRMDFLDFRWVPAEARVVCYSVIVYLCLFRGGEAQSFIYFQF